MANRELHLSDIPFPGTEALERQLIADIVANPDVIGEISAFIGPDSFSEESRRMIWETIVDMYNARETVDLVSVWQKTGQAYIDEIQTKATLDSTRSAAFEHAELLRVSNTKRRAYFAALTVLQQSASAQSSEEQIFGAAEELTRQVQGGANQSSTEKHIGEVMNEIADEIQETEQALKEGRRVRVPTGFPSLDYLFYGGWGKGQLIILAARPSIGKTALMLQFAKTAARSDFPAMVFSLEMTRGELGKRLLFSTGAVSQDQVSRGRVNWSDFEHAVGSFSGIPLYINDEAQTLPGIVSRLTLAVNRGRCKIAFIDFLGLIETDANRRDTLAQVISGVTRKLKLTAKKLGIPIVLLCQLNRKSAEDGREPQLYDLRDSGGIEQDADIVLMLAQKKTAEQGDIPDIDVWIRKNRQFKKDVSVTVRPNETYSNFHEVARPDWYKDETPPAGPSPVYVPFEAGEPF